MLTWKHLGRMWCLLHQYSLYLLDWLTLKEKKRCCQQDSVTSKSARYRRNTTVDIDQWKTTCVVSIPMFFIVLKLNISFILHWVLRVYYFLHKGGIWLRLLLHPHYDVVQIGLITKFPAMGTPFSVFFFAKPAMHSHWINDIDVHKMTLLIHP